MVKIFDYMLRGFGWTLGRQAAMHVPLVLGIITLVILHFFS